MNKILQSANLIWTKGTTSIVVGTISRGLQGKKTVYVLDLDEEQVDKVLELDESNLHTLIPGVDIVEDGYYIEYQLPPYLVEMRVPDRRRTDINEIAEKAGMEYYDEFTFFLYNNGYAGDEWSVEEIL